MNRRPRAKGLAWHHAFACLAIAAAASFASAARPAALMIGSDLSFLPQLEACGARFRDTLGVADAMTIIARHEFGWVRLRLWHCSTGGRSGLSEVLAMARRARQLGLGIMLAHF